MFMRDLKNCEEIIAGDATILRELFNPNKDDLKLRYSLAHAVVKVGEQSKQHILKTSEVYYILEAQEGCTSMTNQKKCILGGQFIFHRMQNSISKIPARLI